MKKPQQTEIDPGRHLEVRTDVGCMSQQTAYVVEKEDQFGHLQKLGGFKMQIQNLPGPADITSDRANPSDMIDPITLAKDKSGQGKGAKKKKVDKSLFDQISNKEASSPLTGFRSTRRSNAGHSTLIRQLDKSPIPVSEYSGEGKTTLRINQPESRTAMQPSQGVSEDFRADNSVSARDGREAGQSDTPQEASAPKPVVPAKVMLQTQLHDGFVVCAQRNLNSDLEEQQDFMLQIDKQKFGNNRGRHVGPKVMLRYGSKGLRKQFPERRRSDLSKDKKHGSHHDTRSSAHLSPQKNSSRLVTTLNETKPTQDKSDTEITSKAINPTEGSGNLLDKKHLSNESFLNEDSALKKDPLAPKFHTYSPFTANSNVGSLPVGFGIRQDERAVLTKQLDERSHSKIEYEPTVPRTSRQGQVSGLSRNRDRNPHIYSNITKETLLNQDSTEKRLTLSHQKHAHNLNLVMSLKRPLGMNEFQTTSSFLKVRATSEVHKPVKKQEKPQANIAQQQLQLYLMEQTQTAESEQDQQQLQFVKTGELSFNQEFNQDLQKKGTFISDGQINFDVQSVMLTEQEDILSRDSRMVNIIDQNGTQSPEALERMEKARHKLLTQIDKCMMNMKVSPEQRDQILRLAKTEMSGENQGGGSGVERSPKKLADKYESILLNRDQFLFEAVKQKLDKAQEQCKRNSTFAKERKSLPTKFGGAGASPTTQTSPQVSNSNFTFDNKLSRPAFSPKKQSKAFIGQVPSKAQTNPSTKGPTRYGNRFGNNTNRRAYSLGVPVPPGPLPQKPVAVMFGEKVSIHKFDEKNGPIQRKSQIVPVIVQKIKQLEFPTILGREFPERMATVKEKESEFDLDATRGLSACNQSNNIETQTNFNIVEYEEQSDINAPPKLAMTQSFHNPHNSRLGKPSDLSDSSNTARRKRTKGYMHQTQTAQMKQIYAQAPTPPAVSDCTNHGVSSSQMRRDNTESSGWLELAQMIVDSGGNNRMQKKGSNKSQTKIPIPKQILENNSNRGLIDLKLSDAQVDEIKQALDEYKSMVALEELQRFQQRYGTASHEQTDSGEEIQDGRQPKRNTTATTVPATGNQKIITKRQHILFDGGESPRFPNSTVKFDGKQVGKTGGESDELSHTITSNNQSAQDVPFTPNQWQGIGSVQREYIDMPIKPVTLSDFGHRENLVQGGANKQPGLQRMPQGVDHGRARDPQAHFDWRNQTFERLFKNNMELSPSHMKELTMEGGSFENSSFIMSDQNALTNQKPSNRLERLKMIKTLAEPEHGTAQNKILSMIVDREFAQYYKQQQRQLQQRQSLGKAHQTPKSISSHLNKLSQDLFPESQVQHDSGGYQYRSSKHKKSKSGYEMQIVEEKSLPKVGDSIYSISEALSSSLPNSMHGVNMNSKGSSHLRESIKRGEQANLEKLLAEGKGGSPRSKLQLGESKKVTPDRRKKDALRSIYSKISSQQDGTINFSDKKKKLAESVGRQQFNMTFKSKVTVSFGSDAPSSL